MQHFQFAVALWVVRGWKLYNLSIPSCCRAWSMRLFLNSMPLSDRMYLRHMCIGKYWFIRVATMVSADLSGIGKASSQPVRWSIMVNIFLLPEVEVSQSVTKSIAILSNVLSGISVICKGYCWTLALSHLQRMQLAIYFLMSLFMPFQ